MQPDEARNIGDEALASERLARLTRLAARGFNRALQIRLAAHGVSFGQWIFLRILWAEDGLSQRELAHRSGLTEPTTHTSLQRLEKQGLIARRHLPGDRRRQHAFLTQAGRDLRDEIEPLAVDVNDIAVRGLDEADQIVLRRALLTVIANLEADEAAAARRGERMPSTRSASYV